MKILSRLTIIAVLATVLIGTVGLKDALAQTPLTNEQLNQISANCQTAKTTLNQLLVTDALLRVNRGQLYEAINSKLMDRFNARLSNNGKDISGLQVVTTSYSNMWSTFRADYVAYEQQLSNAIRVDCAARPADFHAALADARTKRAKLNQDVRRLHQYIDDYRSAVNDLVLNDPALRGDQ